MTVALDLNHLHWKHVRGQFTVAGSWLYDGTNHRPCMAIWNTHDKGEDIRPCVITLDKAWIWSRDVGDEEMAGEALGSFLVQLRLKPDKRTIFKLFSLIEDYLGDLVSMPPYMRPLGEVIAEVTITNRDTGKSREVLLRDV